MSEKMLWFRCYAEIVDDEKLRLLAFEDRWHFVALMACKAAGIVDEAGPLMRRKVAVKLGLDVSTLDEVVRRLAEVELIDRETLQPVAWDRRQHKSDTSAERTRAYRDRLKRHRDVTVTPPETEAEADTEADTEREREARAQEKPARSPSGSRLPEEFPTKDELAWARKERPDLDAALVAACFRDYWTAKAGKDGRKADWPATWRNWVRNERVTPAPRAAPRPAQTRIENTIASLTGRNRQPEYIDVTPTAAACLG